jgi:hypothetical protein
MIEAEAFHRVIRIMGTFDLATGHADSWDELLDSLESELKDVLGHLRARREWHGLTDEDKKEYVAQDFGGSRLDAMDWAEQRLKEKNT